MIKNMLNFNKGQAILFNYLGGYLVLMQVLIDIKATSL